MATRLKNLLPRWQDDLREAVERLARDGRAIQQKVQECSRRVAASALIANKTTMLLAIVAMFLTLLVAAALWERL